MNRKQIYLICLFLSLFFYVGFVSAQEGWHVVRKADWECDFASVFFLPDAQNGWSVGSSGTIVHTADGGSSWSSQTSGTSNPLLSVHFTDSQNGWAVGGAGTIVHTANGGSSWSSQTSGTSNWLYSVHFTDSQSGWAVGNSGTIVHTADGGSSWISQTSGTSNRLYGVHFTDSQNGWVVGRSGTIVHTADGGSSWISQTSGTSKDLSVHFTDSQNGWAVGYSGTIVHTADGGSSWISQTSGTSNYLRSVHFTDSQNGWAVGNSGTIVHTADGGSSWISQTSGTSNPLYSVHFTDSQNGWAVGWLGIVLKYTVPRLVVSDNAPAPGTGVPFGFVLGEDSNSRDWSFKLKNNGSASFTVDGYESSNTAFSVTAPGFPQTLIPNQGIDITLRFSSTETGFYQDSLSFAISGEDTNTVHTVKVSGGALVTTDPLVHSLYRRAVMAYDSAKAYNPNSQAVHNNLGVLFAILNATEEASSEFARSYSKGTEMNRGSVQAIKKDEQQALSTWTNLLEDVNTPSYIKPQIKYNMAWVYDDIDSLETAYSYYSDAAVDSLANNRLKAKAFLGRGVTVFKMSRDSSAANTDFRRAIVLDPYGAGILAQENINMLLTGVHNQPLVKMPQQYVLQQNYPNPFNPKTEISYQLPEQTFVKLEIFNLLGQKVRTLLAKKIQAGYHSVRWDGKDDNGLAVVSGVYLYSIRAKDFRDVKKMVLLR